MVDLLLLAALVERIKDVVQEYRVSDERGILHSIAVVKGFLPPKKNEQLSEQEKYCVLVRLPRGVLEWNKERQQAEAVTKTLIVVRTASQDVEAGPENTLNLMARIQRALYENPYLDDRFKVQFPLEWEGPDGQSWPIWQGEMMVPWMRPMPQDLTDVIGGISNYGG